MKFVLLSTSLFLLPLAAQAEEIGFSYQSTDGTIYTSTTAPSWCRRYYINDAGNMYPSGGNMPYACVNPQFTTSRGPAPRKSAAKWTEGNRSSDDPGDGIFGIFKKKSRVQEETYDDSADYKDDGSKKDRIRDARVPPASGRRSRVREKEIEVEITPVVEGDDEKEGKGLVPPAPIPPPATRIHRSDLGDGDDFGGKEGKDQRRKVEVPPAPGRRGRDGNTRIVIRGNGDPSGKDGKDRVPGVRVPPVSTRDDIPRPPMPIPDPSDDFGGKGSKEGKDQRRIVEVPPPAGYGDGDGDGRYSGKGKKDQRRVVEVPPAPGGHDGYWDGDEPSGSRYGDKGKKDQRRVVEVPPAPDYDGGTGQYDGKGKKEQKRVVQVPPGAKPSKSFMDEWGISLDALRSRLQPVRVVQPSGRVLEPKMATPKVLAPKLQALTVDEERACLERYAPELVPAWVEQVQKATQKKADKDLLGAIRKRTPDQEKCVAEAPKNPSRVVLAFDAFGSFDYVNYYKEKGTELPEKEAEAFKNGNAISNAARKEDRQVAGVHWKYYPKEAALNEQLTPATRCAFELATKPYKNKEGKTVYNTITLVGHSFGGDAAFKVANTLRKLGVRVDLVLTTDPRQSLDAAKRKTFSRPDSVDRWVNFYQQNDPLLKGFPVDGADNVNISDSGAWHGLAPHAEVVRARAAKEVMGLPSCKADLSTPVYIQPKAACAD